MYVCGCVCVCACACGQAVSSNWINKSFPNALVEIDYNAQYTKTIEIKTPQSRRAITKGRTRHINTPLCVRGWGDSSIGSHTSGCGWQDDGRHCWFCQKRGRSARPVQLLPRCNIRYDVPPSYGDRRILMPPTRAAAEDDRRFPRRSGETATASSVYPSAVRPSEGSRLEHRESWSDDDIIMRPLAAVENGDKRWFL